MKKTLIAAALGALLTGHAMASDYYVVVPVKGKTEQVAGISVTLGGYTLPSATVGAAYSGFDFKQLLQVTGDAAYNSSLASWKVLSGALPAGLTLSATGALSGTPTTAGASSFTLEAAYKTKVGQQAYALQVNPAQCTLPWGGTLADGATYSGTVYSANQALEPTTCESLKSTLTCNGGQLSLPSPSTTCTDKDPYWSQVALLMHVNSATGYTTDTAKGHAVQTYNSPVFNVGSGMFGGGVNYASGGMVLPYASDWNLGSANFTMEGWFYNTVQPSNNNYAYDLFARWYSGGLADTRNSFVVGFHPAASGRLYAGVTDGTATSTYVQGTTSPSLNTWHHVAFVRNNSTLYLFLDGKLEGSAAFNGTITNNTGNPLTVGGWVQGSSYYSPSNYPSGANSSPVTVDELRLTVGVARYTANFSRPTKEFANQ